MKISRRGARATIVVCCVALVAAATGGVGALRTATATASVAQAGCEGPYGWPVAPFDQQHPIRGMFGDPRTNFHAEPTLAGLMTGPGSFSFHQGVDIAAADGTNVYPVATGVVKKIKGQGMIVACDNGRAFEYEHVHPQVVAGQRVVAGQTVLGPIIAPAGHVHLTQLDGTGSVNPLGPNGLKPFRDTTVPQVDAITLRATETGPDQLPTFVRGNVLLLASAYDAPPMAVPGDWNGLPVSPAVVRWHIATWAGKIVVPERVARDVRTRVPQNSAFWKAYARGTYQNMAVFGKHYSFLQRGSYIFKLTPEPFDTSTLDDGVYDLVVTVADCSGNSSSRSLRITIHNRPGWAGS
jgi:hypothetical protein